MARLISITILLLALVSCDLGKSKLIEKYKMASYESKAWVDSLNFPIIKIINNSNFEIYKKNALEFEGKIELIDKDTFLVLKNSQRLNVNFLNSKSERIRIWNLTGINIEAKYGDFIRIK